MTITTRMKTHRFEPVEMGGGMVAYVRTDGQTSEIVQCADDPSLLPSIGDNTDVYVCEGDIRHDDVDVGDPTRIVMAGVLAALDDARDEYALIDLRIHAGYGNAWPGHVYRS